MKVKIQIPHNRPPGDFAVPVWPVVEFERTEDAQENVLRWEDDGGPVIEAPSAAPSGGDRHSRCCMGPDRLRPRMENTNRIT